MILQVMPGWFHHDVNLSLQSGAEGIQGKTRDPALLIEFSVLEFYRASCSSNHLTKPWRPTALPPLPLSNFQQKLSSGREKKRWLLGRLILLLVTSRFQNGIKIGLHEYGVLTSRNTSTQGLILHIMWGYMLLFGGFHYSIVYILYILY